MDKIYEKFAQDLKEDRIRSQGEMEKRMDKMEEGVHDMEKKSMQNFAAWRDYLHKYYTIVLAFIAGSGILSSIKSINDYRLSYGILFALVGILIGFLGINVYFYIERKWFQAQNTMRGPAVAYADYHTHPDVDETDTLKSIKFHLRDKLKPFIQELQEAKNNKDKKRISWLKKTIRARKEEIILLNFVGQQYGSIQMLWICFVTGSLTLTFFGIILVFLSVVNL